MKEASGWRRCYGRAFLVGMAILGMAALGLQPVLAADWTKLAGGGMDGKYRVGPATDAMAVFGSKLYAGADGPFGARVMAYDGSQWKQENKGGFGDEHNWSATAMAVYGSKLYVGTQNVLDGAQIWSYDGVTWQREPIPDEWKVRGISVMTVFKGSLYVATDSYPQPCQVWRFNGAKWTRVMEDGFGDGGNTNVSSMMVYDGKLFVGMSNATGCRLHAFDGKDWSKGAEDGFGDPKATGMGSMGIYNGRLYAASSKTDEGAGASMTIYIWEFDGAQWEMIYSHQTVGVVTSMATYKGSLFMNVFDSNYGCHTLRFDGTDWVEAAHSGFGKGGVNVYSPAMTVYQDSLFVATINPQDGTQVWRSSGVGGPPFTDWKKVNRDGFSWNHNTDVSALAVYEGKTYAMTGNAHSGAELWRKDDDSWTRIAKNGFGLEKANQEVSACAVLDSKLYMGTDGAYAGPATLWKFDGVEVTPVNTDGFGLPENRRVSAMAVYKSKLYLATEATGGGRIYRHDGDNEFVQVNLKGFGDRFTTITSMVVYNSLLYVGTDNEHWGAELWTYDGTEWSRVIGAGFNNSDNTAISSMTVMGKILYVGTSNEKDGCEVWRYDPNHGPQSTAWRKVGNEGLGNKFNVSAATMAVHNGKLYVGTGKGLSGDADPSENGCEVWSYDRPNDRWVQENEKGFGNPYNAAIPSMISDGTTLMAGTWNVAYGGMIWGTSGN